MKQKPKSGQHGRGYRERARESHQPLKSPLTFELGAGIRLVYRDLFCIGIMKDLENWRGMIAEEMKAHGESWEDTVDSTLTDEQLDKGFDSGYGQTEGDPFTVWTTKRVYFPICYDGAECCGSVARNPDGHATEHQGGG